MFQEALVEISQTLNLEFQAQVLGRSHGKFHHVTEAWLADQPMMYNLLKLYNTVVNFEYNTKQGKRVQIVYPEKPRVRTNPRVRES